MGEVFVLDRRRVQAPPVTKPLNKTLWGILVGLAASVGVGLGLVVSLTRPPSRTAPPLGPAPAAAEPAFATRQGAKDILSSDRPPTAPSAPTSPVRGSAPPPLPATAVPQKWTDLVLPDDVLTGQALRGKDIEAWRAIVENLDPDSDVSQALDACIAASEKRGGATPTTQRTEWFMYLTIESKDGIGRIVDVEVPEDTWPREFTPEDRDCYRRAYLGFEFKTTHDFRYRYALPACLYPASAQVATTDEEGVEMTSFE